MADRKPPPERQDTLFYEIIRATAETFFDTFYDYTETGMANVPLKGSVILASNHVSFFDPPALGSKLPRQLNYFARDTLFKGWFGTALDKLHCIPVARGSADVSSLKALFRALNSGGGVVIFPEGTRSPDGRLAEPKPGAGMIAIKSRATVVPCRIFGTFETYGRHLKYPKLGGRIHVAYGKPMQTEAIDPGKEHPERYLEGSRRIMAGIEKLGLPDEMLV